MRAALLRTLLAAWAAGMWVLAVPPPVEAGPGPVDWVIQADTTLSGTDRTVEGFLVVMPGATLRLQGATLAVGHGIIVQAGGTLDLEPLGRLPSGLRPLDDDGYWIEDNGTLRLGGSPGATIEGLSGDGAYALLNGGGGIVVRGHLEATGTTIRNSTAGMLVFPGATAVIHDSEFTNVTTLAMGVRGRLLLENASVQGAQVAIEGQDGGILEVRNSTLNASTGIRLANCALHLENTHVRATINGVEATRPRTLTVRDVRLAGYAQNGILVQGDGGPTPTMVFEDVRLEPRAAQEREDDLAGWQGTRGMMITGVEGVHIRRATALGHESHAIEARGGSLDVVDSRLERNGGYGIFAPQARTAGELASNQFGDRKVGTLNGLGAVSNRIRFTAYAVDGDGHPVAGLRVAVFGAVSETALFLREPGSLNVVSVEFEAYLQDPSDRVVFQGPFRYEASHPRLAATSLGTLALDGNDLVVMVPGAAPASDTVVGSLVLTSALLVVLVTLVIWAWRVRISRRPRPPAGFIKPGPVVAPRGRVPPDTRRIEGGTRRAARDPGDAPQGGTLRTKPRP